MTEDHFKDVTEAEVSVSPGQHLADVRAKVERLMHEQLAEAQRRAQARATGAAALPAPSAGANGTAG